MATRLTAVKDGQTVVVTLDGGKTDIVTRGFVGRACLDATRPLEQALGLKTADSPTAEMSQAQRAGQGLQQ